MRYWDGYRGASFTELLASEYPQLAPAFGGAAGAAHATHATEWGAQSAAHAPGALAGHGTTCLALTFEGGVLVAGDRLATFGNQVASREIEKVYATDRHSLVAISGAAGPSIEMARLISVQFEHREKIEGEPLGLEGKANTLSNMIRQNLPAAMRGLIVLPLFAGYDLRRRSGRVWKYEITGGRYEERAFESVGSGSVFAREGLKKSWREGAPREDAIRAALGALQDAADEDRATGGVDAERGIYPRLKTCGAEGVAEVSDEEIATHHAALRERRAAAGARA